MFFYRVCNMCLGCIIQAATGSLTAVPQVSPAADPGTGRAFQVMHLGRCMILAALVIQGILDIGLWLQGGAAINGLLS